MYRVELSDRAQRELGDIRGGYFNRIAVALRGLSLNPRPRGARKITGPIYRIRVGDWRVVYAVFDKDELVVVGKIARRSERTYDGVDRLL